MESLGHTSGLKQGENSRTKRAFLPFNPKITQHKRSVKLKYCLDSQNNRQAVDAVRNVMFSAPFQAILDEKDGIRIYL